MKFTPPLFDNTLITSVLTAPFNKNLPIFFIFVWFSSLVDISNLLISGLIVNVGYILAINSAVSYILTLFYGLLKGRTQQVLFWLIVLLLMTWCFVDLLCITIFRAPFNDDFAAIFRATNMKESQEFMATYFNFKLIGLFLTICVIGFSGYALLKHIIKGRSIIRTTIFSALCLFGLLGFAFRFYDCISRTPLGKTYSVLNSKRIPDLRNYITNYPIESTGISSPTNIVIIIGESFDKKHSSLYGYNKPTNPRLSGLNDSASLFVFKNVISPDLSTQRVFIKFMTGQNVDEKSEWYKSPTLPSILRQIGYKTIWISNQGKKGLYDNYVTRFAELCDTAFFVNKSLSSAQSYGDFDDRVLDVIPNIDINTKTVTFIHLLGSHIDYKSRYPSNRTKFTDSDYLEFPVNQRKTRATYDNSIVFNDSIVNQIIKSYQDKETFLVYFSDHGQDIYETHQDFAGHGNINDPKSLQASCQIPFFVYVSEKYRIKHPEIVQRIENATNRNFNTVDLMYTIMDVAGVKFSDNENVANRSLFRK